VDAWLRSVLWENVLPNDSDEHQDPFEIHRLKGRLVVQNGETKIIQGVRELFEIFDAPSGDAGEKKQTGKMVLIGRHVTDFNFQKSLLAAIA
jgi:G3E family GTPase